MSKKPSKGKWEPIMPFNEEFDKATNIKPVSNPTLNEAVKQSGGLPETKPTLADLWKKTGGNQS